MSDYSFSNDFSVKDGLATGNPNKLIKGSEMDTEFEAIETAVGTKANKVTSATSGNIAEIDSSGDLVDSGMAFTDLVLTGNSVLAPHKNLVVENNSGTPATQMDIDCDEILLSDGSGDYHKASSVNVTMNGAITGANGTEAAIAAGLYYLWVISDGSTEAAFASTTLSPTLPGSYTYKGLVGTNYYNGTTFRDIYQEDNNVSSAEIIVLSEQTIGLSEASVTVKSDNVAPTISKVVSGYAYAEADATNPTTNHIMSLYTKSSSGTALGRNYVGGSTHAASFNNRGIWSITLKGTALYYAGNNSDTKGYIAVTGWRY